MSLITLKKQVNVSANEKIETLFVSAIVLEVKQIEIMKVSPALLCCSSLKKFSMNLFTNHELAQANGIKN